jgi:hypothetical protein
MATVKKRTTRKRKSAAAKIRALIAAGVPKEEILKKGFTRQQHDGALQHTQPAGRPRKPRCPHCGAIVKKFSVRKIVSPPFVVLATTGEAIDAVEPYLRALSDELRLHLQVREIINDSGNPPPEAE